MACSAMTRSSLTDTSNASTREIGPLTGISILLPVTFGLDATKAVIMLAGIYYGSQYGGSTTSILMRIPGEASSVMTCIDGYAMARNGRDMGLRAAGEDAA